MISGSTDSHLLLLIPHRPRDPCPADEVLLKLPPGSAPHRAPVGTGEVRDRYWDHRRDGRTSRGGAAAADRSAEADYRRLTTIVAALVAVDPWELTSSPV